MFELKRRAFLMLGKHKSIACKCALYSSYGQLSAVFSCIVSIMSLFENTRFALRSLPFIGRLWESEYTVLPAVLFALIGSAYSICGHCFSFALYAVLSNSDKKSRIRFTDTVHVHNGIRFILLRLTRIIHITRILFICLLPALLFLLILFLFLAVGVPRFLFITGLILFVLQIFSGTVTACILKERFAVTSYLLCTNPMLSVSDALISSALLTETKILRITAIHVRLFGLRLIVKPFLPFLCSHAYHTAFEIALSEKIYGEQRIKKNDAGIVFYINTDSVIRSEPAPQKNDK